MQKIKLINYRYSVMQKKIKHNQVFYIENTHGIQERKKKFKSIVSNLLNVNYTKKTWMKPTKLKTKLLYKKL